MLLEIFRHFSVFAPMREYRYVGLGSVWFSDFQLFHRALGIPDMISIEREKNAEARIRKNIPFAAITPIFKPTNVALPEIQWNKRQLVWLDYDDPLSPSILDDVGSVISRAMSGSAFAVSVQHQQAKEIDEAGKDGSSLDLFRSRFGRSLLPDDLGEDDLYGQAFARLSRGMIGSEIENALVARNSGLATGEQIQYRKICEIDYADGAPMTTTDGCLVSQSELDLFGSMQLQKVDFCNESNEVVRIKIPKITPKEARFLESQLPSSGSLDQGNIPEWDVRAFAEHYRYLPNFMSVDP